MTILFQTKDLEVTSTMIDVCREVSKKVFFIDNKDGKGISSCDKLELAIDFAKSYQGLLG